jgi:hypothetical protein
MSKTMTETKDHGNGIIEFAADGIIIDTPDDWIGLFSDRNQAAAIIKKENLHPDFYDLTTGFAGALLQKFSTYSKRLAITGDFSEIKSKAFNDFMYESNKTRQIIFVPAAAVALRLWGSPLKSFSQATGR